MNVPATTAADMVEIQLRKWIKKGFVHNTTLRPSYSHPSVPTDETVVAEVVDRTGRRLFFTDNGFTLPERGFIRYASVRSVMWISSRPDRFTRKLEDYDHIELLLYDGSSTTLADVGQAVFPLLKFFEWMIERR